MLNLVSRYLEMNDIDLYIINNINPSMIIQKSTGQNQKPCVDYVIHYLSQKDILLIYDRLTRYFFTRQHTGYYITDTFFYIEPHRDHLDDKFLHSEYVIMDINYMKKMVRDSILNEIIYEDR